MSSPWRLLILSSFNADNLVALLGNEDSEPRVEATGSQYGPVQPRLANPEDALRSGAYDGLLVWTQPQDAIPSFGSVLAHEEFTTEQILSEVDDFSELVASVADSFKTVLVPSWVAAVDQRGLGILDMNSGYGVARLLMRMNLHLSERLGSAPNVFVLNTQKWISRVGTSAFSSKLWYLAKVPFTTALFSEAIRDIKTAVVAVEGRSRKLVVVDLDDTMWGGIVGEVGWEGLTLGGHDPVGEAYVDFQRALKALTRRGVALGIVSKNDERVALEAVERHPEMVLRKEDFAGWRINWSDKARNVVELVDELNLGLDSVVFIDDNPAERGRVREALPEVLVPDWPRDVTAFPGALRQLSCFDSAALTSEDRNRAAMYASERRRKASLAQVDSVDDWLARIGLVVEVERLSPANRARAAQLLNKTNQFNLATRRLSESELAEWAEVPAHEMLTFRVTDDFGELGVVGLVGTEQDGGRTTIVDFVLSCRAFGRRVEQVMLATVIERAGRGSGTEVVARFRPTPKNRPCLDFLKAADLPYDEETETFRWPVGDEYPFPRHVELRIAEDLESAVG